MLRPIKLKDKILEVPIIQGGMGIGVSLSNLASSVRKEGGMGVISAAMPGFNEPDFETMQDFFGLDKSIYFQRGGVP